MSKEFDYLFHPRSIAIAGASLDPTKWMKQYFLLALLAFEFDGDIYPVNPGARETAGLKAYSRLIGESGSSTINPVESMATVMPEVFPQVIRTVARCEDIDLMLVVIRVSAILNIPGQNGLSAELNKALIRSVRASNKTICVVLQSASSVEESKVAAMLQRELVEAGFPVYSTIARAANAISKCFDYYKQQAK